MARSKNKRARASRLKWVIWGLLLVLFGYFSLANRGSWAGAQDELPAANSTSPDGAVVVDDAAEDQVPTITGGAPEEIELDEKAPQKSLTEKIDGLFSEAVNQVAGVLFYRLAADQRNYVVVEHVEHYVRPRGTTGDFVRHDPRGTYADDAIDANEANALEARGKLIKGSDKDTSWREGKIGDRKIEYITIKIDVDTKYVRAGDDKFHKLLAKRSLLSDEPDDVLSQAQVERLAKLGRLQLTATAKKARQLEKEGKSPERELAATIQAQREEWGELAPYVHQEADPNSGVPLVVLWLALGAIFFTIYMRGVNIWGFRHALSIVRGRYDNPDEDGEVTHFQALASALSATVGLGNIAGVTIAMTVGGPGAFFWMMVCGLFGMTSKFVECSLGQKYRQVKPDGTVLGGPMTYLHSGLAELGLGPLGAGAAVLFAVMCILASFGGGNMFQANQSGDALMAMLTLDERKQSEDLDAEIRKAAEAEDFEQLASLQKERKTLTDEMNDFETVFKPVFGIVLAVLVGVVIVGGISRIGAAAEKLVPSMCLIYIASCLWIIGVHLDRVPGLIGQIFSQAFTGTAFGGGLVGVIVLGVQRAAFSNEAGVGSAAIAHSAAKTEEPIREGFVALLGPFIDTIVICSMTALVILITGAWDNSVWVVDQGLQGAALTQRAFREEISWFPYVLGVAVVLFAYSTIISWSYYGERCWERLFGPRSTFVYKILTLTCVFVGTIANLGAVLDFSDMMILSMAFPNVLGCALLAPKIRRDLADYWRRYRADEFKTYK